MILRLTSKQASKQAEGFQIGQSSKQRGVLLAYLLISKSGSDTSSEVYRYSWDKEDLRSYPWKNRYLSQPEIKAYLNHVVERHHLREYIELNTEMASAEFEDKAWTVRLNTGETVRTRYLVTALGGLSKTNLPNIPGIGTVSGDLYHCNWRRRRLRYLVVRTRF